MAGGPNRDTTHRTALSRVSHTRPGPSHTPTVLQCRETTLLFCWHKCDHVELNAVLQHLWSPHTRQLSTNTGGCALPNGHRLRTVTPPVLGTAAVTLQHSELLHCPHLKSTQGPQQEGHAACFCPDQTPPGLHTTTCFIDAWKRPWKCFSCARARHSHLSRGATEMKLCCR